MKNVWIFNHYAGPPSISSSARHYSISRYLKSYGYNIIIFAASTIHNTNRNLIEEDIEYRKEIKEGICFVFIKTRNYVGNAMNRILNMFDYYRGLFSVTNHFDKPDVIIGSSVHPLACIAAIKLAKKYKCQCICEIRDLWPESLVAYKIIKKSSLITKLLYHGEQWIYKKADKIIFTMEGGKDYIVDKGWNKENSGPIDLNKVFHINNGIDIEEFNNNKASFIINDIDLGDDHFFKAVYAGSIRLSNNIDILLDAAKLILQAGKTNIKIIVYGDGDNLENLKIRKKIENISNVLFKGQVDKRYIPYILSKSNLNILDLYNSDIFRYGVSPNKLFDYLACGKPILSGLNCNYDIITKYKCGITLNTISPEKIAKFIIEFSEMNIIDIDKYSYNSISTAYKYTYLLHAQKLHEIICQ